MKRDQGAYVEALRQGLRELGYIEGKTFIIEYRAPKANWIGFPRSLLSW